MQPGRVARLNGVGSVLQVHLHVPKDEQGL